MHLTNCSPVLNTHLKFQTFINGRKLSRENFPHVTREPTTGASGEVFHQILTRTKSRGSKDWKDECALKPANKVPENIRHKLQQPAIDRIKVNQSAGEGSNRSRNTPLKAYNPSRTRIGYDPRNSIFVNTPTLTCSGVSASFEKPSKTHLSSSIMETNAVTHHGDVIPKSLKNPNSEAEIEDPSKKRTTVLVDEFAKQIHKALDERQMQVKLITQKSQPNIGTTQRPATREKPKNTLKLKDFYLLRESPTKNSLSQQLIKQTYSRESYDSGKKSIRFIETPKEAGSIAARSIRHVKSVSGHYVQIRGPMNQQEVDMYHVPVSRFNQTISEKESRNLLRSVSYYNSRKQSESRENVSRCDGELRPTEKSFKGSVGQSTVLGESRDTNIMTNQSRVMTREDQDGKVVKAWRINHLGGASRENRKEEDRIVGDNPEIPELQESDTKREKERDYKLEEDEEIVDTTRQGKTGAVETSDKRKEGEEGEKEEKSSEPVSVERRQSREILLSYKNRKTGLFINHQKVAFSSYIKAVNSSKHRYDEQKSKEDLSIDTIKPLEKTTRREP